MSNLVITKFPVIPCWVSSSRTANHARQIGFLGLLFQSFYLRCGKKTIFGVTLALEFSKKPLPNVFKQK